MQRGRKRRRRANGGPRRRAEAENDLRGGRSGATTQRAARREGSGGGGGSSQGGRRKRVIAWANGRKNKQRRTNGGGSQGVRPEEAEGLSEFVHLLKVGARAEEEGVTERRAGKAPCFYCVPFAAAKSSKGGSLFPFDESFPGRKRLSLVLPPTGCTTSKKEAICICMHSLWVLPLSSAHSPAHRLEST